jgi:broad specificity phosphatase PhoE
MGSLLFARHGETDWNREGRWQGHADVPLNALGRKQARELATRLADASLTVVYSSDLRRALETAEIVARALRLEVVAEPGLREIDVGSWSGLTHDEIAARFPGWATHDGEPVEAFRVRVLGTVNRIATTHERERVLLVCHGGCVRTVQRHVHGEALPVIDNCGLFGLSFDGAFRALDSAQWMTTRPGTRANRSR